jgi:hypothetical protein
MKVKSSQQVLAAVTKCVFSAAPLHFLTVTPHFSAVAPQ